MERLQVESIAQENLILVGVRVAGSAGKEIIANLCNSVKEALQSTSFSSEYKIECIRPSELNLLEEIKIVRRAKLIISVHGTISYMALFSQDYTMQISIADPKELKENQILLFSSHFQTLYLTWNRIHELSGLIEHALATSKEYFDFP